jgi:uncharacterized membrane protein
MNVVITLISIGIIIGFPFLARIIEKHPKTPSFFSAVVLCYAIGILLGNLIPRFIDTKIAEQLAGAGMIIALPLLLFGADIKENWQLARGGLISFGLCALAGIISTSIVAYLFKSYQSDSWKIAGMLTGLFTGGTPNMNTIGLAVEAPANYVVLLQAADIIGGGIYLLLLMTVIHPFLSFFLPDFKLPDSLKEADGIAIKANTSPFYLFPTLLSLLIGGGAVGLTILFTGKMEDIAIIILLLTSISLLASSYPWVKQLGHTYEQGEYFLLIFCVALGLQSNFAELLDGGIPLLSFTIAALIGTILLHWLFAYLFKIDRDTVMVSSAAALYSPVFIPQITSSIKNRRLLAPGIALGLLGLALGNYLGIGLAFVAKWLFGQ